MDKVEKVFKQVKILYIVGNWPDLLYINNRIHDFYRNRIS
mgnify:CR=1 FL=1